MYTARTLRSTTFPPEHHIIGSGLLKHNSIFIIGGPPKSMKSMISMGIAIDLACGRPVFGARRQGSLSEPSFPVSQSHRILIIEKEIGYEDFQVRLNSMWSVLPSDHQARVDENLLVESCNLDLRLDTTDGTRALAAIIQQARADVVIFDPLVEFHSLDENSSRDMGIVFGNLDLLRYKLGFATILNHHRTKLSRDPGVVNDDDPETLRGSSRVFGKVDSVMMLRPNGRAGQVFASFTLRRGRPIPPLRLRVDLGTLSTSFDGWLNDPPEPDSTPKYRM